METPNKLKIINDPVFGFIKIPSELIYDLLQHPYMLRLTRIKQLGLTSYVYPGTQHTRFQHSLGALFLMTQAVAGLRSKGVEISDEEADGVYAAITLHDIGHGPFSHTLEDSFFTGVSHEDIGLAVINQLNAQMDGRLDIAIAILKDVYPKKFLHELVSGQLDMDRLDYLRRDSFFSGVSEGNIGSARIIKMLDIKDGKLVVEAKGIYSIENFLMSRRLMYWQVYFHKTAYAAERMLHNTIARAKLLRRKGKDAASPARRYPGHENRRTERVLYRPFRGCGKSPRKRPGSIPVPGGRTGASFHAGPFPGSARLLYSGVRRSVFQPGTVRRHSLWLQGPPLRQHSRYDVPHPQRRLWARSTAPYPAGYLRAQFRVL